MPPVVVVGGAAVTLPPPVATEKVTVTPGFALPNPSVTRTDGGTATVVPMRAIWLFPALIAMFAAAAAPTVTAAVCEIGTFPAPASAAADTVLASAVVEVKVAVNVPPALVVPDAGLSVLLVPVDDSVTFELPIWLLKPYLTVIIIVESVYTANHACLRAV